MNNDENDYNNDKDKKELINMNKELINKISKLKKEVEFSKNQMKKKDEKFLKYKDKFDQMASQNAYNIAEIENLEEQLMHRKNEMAIKTKKINELMNKNIDLKQEVNQLKIYFKSKEYNSSEINYSNYNDNNINDKEYMGEDEDGEYNNNQYEDNYIKNEFEELSLDELHTKRNTLIKQRNDINFLYNKLPIKLISKEQIRQKNELEKKLTKINNDLMKIRLQMKNYEQ